MGKTVSIFLLLILIVSASTIIGIISFFSQNSEEYNKICMNNHCFHIEIAQTQEQREKGLMYRDSLKSNKGMLFIFTNEDYHSFWMKNTKIPLDIIWISSDLKVVHIEQNVLPCLSDPCLSYDSPKPALYVLEINAGETEKCNIKLNDPVDLTNILK